MADHTAQNHPAERTAGDTTWLPEWLTKGARVIAIILVVAIVAFLIAFPLIRAGWRNSHSGNVEHSVAVGTPAVQATITQVEPTLCPELTPTSGEQTCAYRNGYRIPVSLPSGQICGNGLLHSVRTYLYTDDRGYIVGPESWTGNDVDRERHKTELDGAGDGTVTYRPC